MTSLIWPFPRRPAPPGVFDEIFNIGLQSVSNYGIGRAEERRTTPRHPGSRRTDGRSEQRIVWRPRRLQQLSHLPALRRFLTDQPAPY